MYTYEDFLKVIATLWGENGCPWDREQTHGSLAQPMLEEVYEAVDGIRTFEETGDDTNLREELGDMLLHVVMHAQIAAEDGRFTMADVVDGICEKMIHRHPHVFGGESVKSSSQVLERWEEIKKKEKKEMTLSDTLERVAKAYPANIRAQKVQKKAAKAGLTPLSAEQALRLVQEEADRLAAVLAEEKTVEAQEAAETGHTENGEIEAVFGRLLFSVVNLSGILGINAENSLTNVTNQFINKCKDMEQSVCQDGRKLSQLSAEEKDSFWWSMS